MQDYRLLGIENECKYITMSLETEKVNKFFSQPMMMWFFFSNLYKSNITQIIIICQLN